MKLQLARRAVIELLVVGVCFTATFSRGLTITGGPSFSPSASAPLAGTLQLTTDVPSRVKVSVTDGQQSWQRSFHDYSTTHSIPLLGFKPGSTNQISVTVLDQSWNSVDAPSPLLFLAPPLPIDFPPCVLMSSQPDKMEPGYTLFRIVNRNSNRAYLGIVDASGDVVWYSAIATTSDVRQLANGNLFIPLTTSFMEVNMLGSTVQTWNVPNGLTINLHDGVPTPHDTILYLNDASEVVTNFPTSATNPNAPTVTTNVLYNRVIEISATNSSLLNMWSPIDFLDPRRLTYLTFDSRTALGWDIEHSNAVIEDPRDNTLIVSMRDQNAVIKFYRDTGQIKWILSPPENWAPEFQPFLLTPVGSPFQWQFGQHAPTITPQGTLLLFDDGNFRAMPFDPPVANSNNFSRAVEYSIDEQNMQVSQVWDYGSSTNVEQFYVNQVGNTEWEPQTGNVLINFGYVSFDNHVAPSTIAPAASMVRLVEVTHDAVPEVVWDLSFFNNSNTNASYLGCYIYRSHRIPDLYAHPAVPVQDLVISFAGQSPQLLFSGDETRTYMVQASTDLVNWQNLGKASQESTGNFQYSDPGATQLNARYYRIVTQ